MTAIFVPLSLKHLKTTMNYIDLAKLNDFLW